MAKTTQKMIVTATMQKDGNVKLDLDFFPPLPKSQEEYMQLPEARKATTAIINKMGLINQKVVDDLVNAGASVGLSEIKKEAAPDAKEG